MIGDLKVDALVDTGSDLDAMDRDLSLLQDFLMHQWHLGCP